MTIKRFILTAIIISIFMPYAHADAAKFEASGYARNFLILTDTGEDTSVDVLSRLRFRLNIITSDSSSLEIAYELLPRFRDVDMISSSVPDSALLAYRAFDIDEKIVPHDDTAGGDFELTQNIDRLVLNFSTSSLDISLGRQPVAFGSARVINPTDIIAPFTYSTIAKEELVGADAFRIKTPLAEMGELDIGVVFGDDFEPDKSAAFIRLKTYQLQTDMSFMAMVFRENILLGIDVTRSIGGAGAWLEAAQTFAEERSEENYFRLSVGADYSFAEGLYTYIEYHYSGAGTGRPENYFDAVTETAFTDGAVYLLGRHYIAPGFNYEITPLLVFNAQALVNIEDGSILGSAGFEYSVIQDVYINLGVYAGLGERPPDPGKPKNEFGLYPDVYYASLNMYF